MSKLVYRRSKLGYAAGATGMWHAAALSSARTAWQETTETASTRPPTGSSPTPRRPPDRLHAVPPCGQMWPGAAQPGPQRGRCAVDPSRTGADRGGRWRSAAGVTSSLVVGLGPPNSGLAKVEADAYRGYGQMCEQGEKAQMIRSIPGGMVLTVKRAFTVPGIR